MANSGSGKRLVLTLLRAGATKYRLAKMLGISYPTICYWEKGVFEPLPEHRKALLRLIRMVEKNQILFSAGREPEIQKNKIFNLLNP